MTKLTEKQMQGLVAVDPRSGRFRNMTATRAEYYDFEQDRIWEVERRQNNRWYLNCNYYDYPNLREMGAPVTRFDFNEGSLQEALQEALDASPRLDTLIEAWQVYRKRYPRSVNAGLAGQGSPLARDLFTMLNGLEAELAAVEDTKHRAMEG